MSKAVRIGLNGFGRIGRAVAKIILDTPGLELAAINDIGADVRNFAYLFNYDSTYGRSSHVATVDATGRHLHLDGRGLPFYGHEQLTDVPWDERAIDVVIEATGVSANTARCRTLVEAGKARKVIVTHSPSEYVDRIVILGVNDQEYNPKNDHVVASSICDANAVAHVLKALDTTLGLESGFVTTLHPWLSYQNLVDSPVASQSSPKHPWADYALGRASVSALIPKNTTATDAVLKVLPHLAGRLDSFSYRTPTSIVSTADLSLRTRKKTSVTEVQAILQGLADRCPYVTVNHESLVSVDFVKTSSSAVIDARWTKVVGDDMVKVVVWYDNEWAYSSRVVDLVRLVMD